MSLYLFTEDIERDLLKAGFELELEIELPARPQARGQSQALGVLRLWYAPEHGTLITRNWADGRCDVYAKPGEHLPIVLAPKPTPLQEVAS